MHVHPPARRASASGFTLIELLMVISIIAVLMGLLIPGINAARQSAAQAQSMNKQRAIAGALISYLDDQQSWPEASDPLAAMHPDNKANAHIATVGAFAVLLKALPDDLRSSSFEAPWSNTRIPDGHPDLDNVSDWGWHPSNSTRRIAYAFDWSAPVSPSSNRIWIGDRNHDTITSREAVVCFGDAHTEIIDISEEIGSVGADPTMTTFGIATTRSAIYTEVGEDGDNIWDGEGDIAAGDNADRLFLPGAGHERRMHLK